MGWRGVYYLTGSLGLFLAIVIFLGVKEMPRGKSEPEMVEFEQITTYRFDLKIAKDLFRKRSLLLLFAQGFVGVFPWNMITYWFFRYLETERNYASEAVFMTMAPAILVLASGYFIGGTIGDFLFKRNPRGRMYVALFGVFSGAILLSITMSVPIENQNVFLIMLMATALFMPFSSPNVISTVYDITLPEVRSTALAIQYFIENGGAAIAPLLGGIIAKTASLHLAILIICVSAWILGAVFLAFTAYLVPEDIRTLRGQMRQRAELEKREAIT
jgi:MFS family permease